MPLRKKSYRKKRFTRRKYGKTRFSRKSKTTNVNRALKPFASRYITKMKYSEAFALSAGVAWSQVMNLNSIYDPNATGTGHQPYGHDQLLPIYNRYRVISCSYVINCYNATSPIRFGCLPCNSTPPMNNLSELCENPRAKFGIQIPGGSSRTVKGKVYIPSLMGRNKSQYMADDRFQAQMGSSPLEEAILFITAQTMTDSSVDTSLVVTLEYTVEFFDPKPIDQS